MSLEYSYVDAIKDDFPWEKLELEEETESKIKALASDYLDKKNKIREEIEYLNSKKLAKEDHGDLELEISDLNYQLKLLSSELSLKIRFLLNKKKLISFLIYVLNLIEFHHY